MIITVNQNKIKTLNQKSYDILINNLDFNNLSCSCAHRACLIKHGYYKRSYKSRDIIKSFITILRVKCNICGKTHSIIPIDIIPYSQVLLSQQVTIISNHTNRQSQENLMSEYPLIDEINIRYILGNYKKYWHSRLIAIGLSIKANLFHLVSSCVSSFTRHFMQNKCTPIIYFNTTHIR